MKNAPTPDLVARSVLRLVNSVQPPPRITVGDTFQSKIALSDFQISSATRPVMGIEEVLPDMTAISEAVILMAGEGSRLRGSDNTFLKPFVPLLGRPLICTCSRCPDPRRDHKRQLCGRLRKRAHDRAGQAVDPFRPQRHLHRKPRLAKTKWHLTSCGRRPPQQTLSSHDERPSFRSCRRRSCARFFRCRFP